MSEQRDILSQVNALQHRVQLVRLCSIVLQVVALCSGVLIGLGSIDRWLRPELPLWRWIMSCGFWMAIGGICAIYLIRWLRMRIAPLHVGLSLDRLLSDSEGEFSGALALLASQGLSKIDPVWRHEILAGLQQPLEDLKLIRIRSRPVIMGLLFIVVSGTTISLVAHDWIWIAAQRMAIPNSPIRWPRTTELVIVDPTGQTIPEGSTVEVLSSQIVRFEAYNALGELPADLVLELDRGDRRVQRIPLQTKRLQRFLKSKLRRIEMTIPTSVSTMTRFRVVGGDHPAGDWIKLRRQRIPQLLQSRCEVHPPEYLNRLVQTYSQWSGPIDLISDSDILLEFDFDLPVARAFLKHPQTEKLIASEQASPTAHHVFKLRMDGSAPAELVYEVHISYALEGDQLKIGAKSRHVRDVTFQVTPDVPPQVQIIEPTSNASVTPRARIPVRAVGRDDYGLTSFALVIDSPQSVSIPGTISTDQLSGEISRMIDLSKMTLDVGDQLEISISAQDARPDSDVSHSSAVTFAVVSDAEKVEEITQLLKEIVRSVATIHSQQADLNRTLKMLISRLNDEMLDQSEVAAESRVIAMRQSVLIERIRSDLLPENLHPAQRDFELNKVDDRVLDSWLRKLQSGLSSVAENRFTLMDDLLRRLEPQSRRPQNEALSLEEDLHQLGDLQDLVEADLVQLVDEFAEWVESADLRTRWRLIERRLGTLLEETKSLSQVTVSKRIDQLTESQRESLEEMTTSYQLLRVETGRYFEAVAESQTARLHTFGLPVVDQLLAQEVSDALAETVALLRDNNVLAAIETVRKLQDRMKSLQDHGTPKNGETSSQLLETAITLRQEIERIWREQSDFLQQVQQLQAVDSEFRNRQHLVNQELQIFEGKLGSTEFMTVRRLIRDALELTSNVSDGEKLLNHSEQIARQTQLAALLRAAHVEIESLLGRVASSESSRLLEQISETAARLAEVQAEINTTADPLVAEIDQSLRLSRTSRRLLLSIGGRQKEIADQIAELLKHSETTPKIKQVLSMLHTKVTSAVAALEREQLDSGLKLSLRWIELTLRSLARFQADGPLTIDPAESSSSTPEEIEKHYSLSVILALQEGVHAETKRLLDLPEQDRRAMQQVLAEQQAFVTSMLEQFFAVKPETD